MSDIAEIYIDDVKTALNITGTYQDEAIAAYIDEVIAFLNDSGVNTKNVTSGIVTRGVADLWDYGSGEGQLSEYFIYRATQLSYK